MAFVVLALPRSRTTWLSKFLTYNDWFCGHDELIKMRQTEDVKSWLSQENTGTVETAAAPFWRLALNLKPDLKIVTIRRDPEEAAISAAKAGFGDNLLETFKYLDHKLGQIERRTGCKSYKYEDLTQEEVCKDLFEHLLPYEHDSAWWQVADGCNIQTDPRPLQRYMTANWPQIDRLRGIAHQNELTNLVSKRVTDTDGMTLEFIPFTEALQQSEFVRREHCAAIGEHPDNLNEKNLALFQAYENMGALQTTVARSNGRLFGYLVTIIGDSFEKPGKLTGCHSVFYASPDCPGLGLKLQRKAIEGLRERGVHEVAMRAGVRGSGDRISALYRRVGAEPFGTYYRLQLEEV